MTEAETELKKMLQSIIDNATRPYISGSAHILVHQVPAFLIKDAGELLKKLN